MWASSIKDNGFGICGGPMSPSVILHWSYLRAAVTYIPEYPLVLGITACLAMGLAVIVEETDAHKVDLGYRDAMVSI